MIAAGGYNSPGNSVEKYVPSEDSWTFLNDLPIEELFYTESVPYMDSFVFVGGNSLGDQIDSILHYKPEQDSWVVIEGALKNPKEDVTGILVKRSIFPPCEDGS